MHSRMLCCVEKGSGSGFEFYERQFAHGWTPSEEIQPIWDIQSTENDTKPTSKSVASHG